MEGIPQIDILLVCGSLVVGGIVGGMVGRYGWAVWLGGMVGRYGWAVWLGGIVGGMG